MFQEHVLQNPFFEMKVLPEFGCHWSSLRLNLNGQWLDLLLPAPSHAALVKKPGAYGSYLLAPWSNRIQGASFEFDRQTYRLKKNSNDGTAIHGDVRLRPWKVVRSTPTLFEAELESANFPDFNFPFPFHYRHNVEICDNRITAGMWVRNLGATKAPAGLGFHPYFLRRLTTEDPDVELTLPAEKVYPASKCIPTGPAIPVSGNNDLRARCLLGKRGLDHCYTAIKAGPVKILYPGTRVEILMRSDSLYNHAVVYAPDSWRGWGKPRPYFCVEPVTHVNDGFNLFARGWEGTGVKELEPGESWGGCFELTYTQVD